MTTIIDKEDIQQYVGFETKGAEWFTVTQDQINQFADCTHDQQFIHTDPEKAKETPFGTTIAHGFLTLSLLSHLAEDCRVTIKGIYMGINYGFDKVRFIAPVKVNSRIRANAKVLEVVEKKPGQFQFKTEISVEIQGENKPALTAEWLVQQMIA